MPGIVSTNRRTRLLVLCISGFLLDCRGALFSGGTQGKVPAAQSTPRTTSTDSTVSTNTLGAGASANQPTPFPTQFGGSGTTGGSVGGTTISGNTGVPNGQCPQCGAAYLYYPQGGGSINFSYSIGLINRSLNGRAQCAAAGMAIDNEMRQGINATLCTCICCVVQQAVGGLRPPICLNYLGTPPT